MNNPVFAEGTARLFGVESADKAKQEAVLLMYLNILLTCFKLMKSGVVTPEVYKEHMTSFFGSVRADRDALMRAIQLPGYEKSPGRVPQVCRRVTMLNDSDASFGRQFDRYSRDSPTRVEPYFFELVYGLSIIHPARDATFYAGSP